MNCIEAAGKTVDEAIVNGLNQMHLSIDEVDIEILHEGSKGLFGIGGKPAQVRLTQREEEEAVEASPADAFLKGLFKRMNVDADTNISETDNEIHIEITGKTAGILIGHRGETLDALQYLTSLVVNQRNDHFKRVTLDTENYRAKREESLTRLARNLANKVRQNGKRVTLEPMNPYERRVLHATLQHNKFVETHSEGDEPNRRVVITPKRG